MVLPLINDDKIDAKHVEMSTKEPIHGVASRDDEVSADDRHAGRFKTTFKNIKTYKHASLVCMLAAVGALSDGYQIQMSGSIVALPGFIQTFGDLQTSGEHVINPQYLALWGCKYYIYLKYCQISYQIQALKNVAAMFGAGIGSYPSDKLGRRWMILTVQVIMIGACILEQLSTHWTHWLGARLLDVSD